MCMYVDAIVYWAVSIHVHIEKRIYIYICAFVLCMFEYFELFRRSCLFATLYVNINIYMQYIYVYILYFTYCNVQYVYIYIQTLYYYTCIYMMDIYWHHITSFSPRSKVRRWFVSEEGALAKSNLQKFPQHQGIIMAVPWDYNIYIYMGMDQYLLIPFLVGWTSIYQLFWCSPGVQGFDTLPYLSHGFVGYIYMYYYVHNGLVIYI